MIRSQITTYISSSLLLGALVYIFHQRCQIVSLNTQIDELQSEVSRLSRSGIENGDRYPQNLALDGGLRGSRNVHNNEEEEGGDDSSWKLKSIRKLFVSSHEEIASRHYVVPGEHDVLSELDIRFFLNELFSELDGISTATTTYNYLTGELSRIASFLDTRRKLDVSSNSNQHESTGLGDEDNSDNRRSLLEQWNDAMNNRQLEEGETGALYEQLSLGDPILQLETQKNLIGSYNRRMGELNTLLHDSVLEEIYLNQNLTAENHVLHNSVWGLGGEVGRLQNERDLLLRQIEALNGDVGGLLDNLEEQMRLNDQLNASVQELNRQTQNLNNSNARYAELNSQLNESISELRTQNQFLAEQNRVYADLNLNLNATAANLSGQVDRLESGVDDLEVQNDKLSDLVESLNGEISNLSNINDDLNVTVQNLTSEVDRLSNENDRLEHLTTELSTIMSFLNETASDIDETFEGVTDFLAEQIAAYRSVVMETLQNTYIQRVANWDCSFRDTFNNEAFINNGSSQIPNGIYTRVMNYIDDRVLSNLCLDVVDFRRYLENRFDEAPTTMNHLISGVEGYTTAALDFYFPDEGEVDSGLSADQWATAGYDCENLPQDEQFVFDVSTA